jgi:hypothetical protein
MGQGATYSSLATMDPSTYQNIQAFQQQHRAMMAQPQQLTQQVNAPNASVATMGPDTFQNSPYTQGGYNMGGQPQQMNQQQNRQLQEQNYLQNVRQTLGTQAGQQINYKQPIQ